MITSAKQRAVLAALALRANRITSMTELVETVWDDNPPASARRLIHTYVWQLRRLLIPAEPSDRLPRIVSCPDGYLLRVEEEELDAAVFERLAREGDAALAAGDAELAERLLARGLALWSGEPATGTCLNGATAAEARRLVELRRRARDAKIRAELRLGRQAALVPELQVLIAEDPLNEQLHAYLIEALSRCGRRAEALQAYATARRRLVSELGLEPGEALHTLHEAVLRGDPAATCDDIPPERPAARALPRVVPRQLPAATPRFTGRQEQLDAMSELLGEDSRSVVIAISGGAGIGKTALAVHWAHQVSGNFPDGQLHVNLQGFDPCGEQMPPTDVIRGFLDALEIPPARIPDALGAQVGLYRSLLAGKRMLLLLDNARDADQIRPLLPGSPGSLAIITSRGNLTGLVALDGASPISLDVLREAEAQELLARHLGPRRAEGNGQALRELAGLCARLPLALCVTAARAVTHPEMSLADVAAQLRGAERSLDLLDTGEPLTSVRAVFSWSCRHLSAPAARMFRLLGEHPGPDICLRAAASLAGLPVPLARAALTELTHAHLLAEHPEGRYAFHDLLRAYAAEEACRGEREHERRAALRRVLDHYLHTAYHATVQWDCLALDPPVLRPPGPRVSLTSLNGREEALSWFQAEHRVILAMVRYAAANGFDIHAWQLAWAIGRFLDWQGYWRTWVGVQRTALEAARRLSDRHAVALMCLHLGRAYTRLGGYRQAHTHYLLALGLYRRCGDPAGEALTRLNLGMLSEKQGQLAGALANATAALRLYEGQHHTSGQANAHNDIGWMHALLGNYPQAVSSCRLALSLSRECGDRYCQACASDSLGYTLQQLGDYRQAIGCHEEAVSLFVNLGDRFNQAEVLTHLGDARQGLGDTEAAHAAWRSAMDILEDLGHPNSLELRRRLGQ